MIKYRTVIVDAEMKSKSSMSSKRFIIDTHELRIQIQSKLEEYDEMGYDLFEMETILSSQHGSSFVEAVLIVFKLRE